MRVLPAPMNAMPSSMTLPTTLRGLSTAPTPTLARRGRRGHAGRYYDTVLLEETRGDWTEHVTGHLDLTTFFADIGRTAPERCDHACHRRRRHSPRTSQPADVGTVAPVVRVGGSGGGRRRAQARQREPDEKPPRRVLLPGGARSGKSVEAERRFAAEPKVTYVATSIVDPADEEWVARVTTHRARRPPQWTTIETVELAALLREATGPVLVDCLTLWLGAFLDAPDLHDRIDDLINAWRGTTANVIAVSKEVGSGGRPATESGATFPRRAGSAQRAHRRRIRRGGAAGRG